MHAAILHERQSAKAFVFCRVNLQAHDKYTVLNEISDIKPRQVWTLAAALCNRKRHFSSSFILNRNLKKPANIFGLFTTTIFTIHTSISHSAVISLYEKQNCFTFAVHCKDRGRSMQWLLKSSGSDKNQKPMQAVLHQPQWQLGRAVSFRSSSALPFFPLPLW